MSTISAAYAVDPDRDDRKSAARFQSPVWGFTSGIPVVVFRSLFVENTAISMITVSVTNDSMSRCRSTPVLMS